MLDEWENLTEKFQILDWSGFEPEASAVRGLR